MKTPAPTEHADSGTTRRSRGRPRTFDREAALAQATRLFWAKGYEATSIADLTAEMGIGAPSLYAAFRSKEALYAEAIEHYAKTIEPMFWQGFFAAETARAAVSALLHDTAAALGGRQLAVNGCMMTLSSVGSEGYPALGDLVKAARGEGYKRVRKRLKQAMSDGEIPTSVDANALARFVQLVQSGMSLLARDGARRAQLDSVAEVAMTAWDARTGVVGATAASSERPRRPRKAAA